MFLHNSPKWKMFFREEFLMIEESDEDERMNLIVKKMKELKKQYKQELKDDVFVWNEEFRNPQTNEIIKKGLIKKPIEEITKESTIDLDNPHYPHWGAGREMMDQF